MIKKVENAFPWTYGIDDLVGEEVVATFYKKELQKKRKKKQKEFRIEKAIKKKSDKLYVEWKSYNNEINGWVDKYT